MKKTKGLAILISSMLLIGSLSLLSFSNAKGGDSFEIYINGKLMVQQYLHMDKSVKSLQLTNVAINDKFDVYFSHCGQTGKNRSITVKDVKGNALKEFHFADATGKSAMSFQLKDIPGVQKNIGNKITLQYASKELPKGLTLASISSESRSVTSR